MSLSLLVFPSIWEGFIKCDKDAFEGFLECSRCSNKSTTHKICACHGQCQSHCTAALTKPRTPPNWRAMLEPYVNVAVTADWAKQVVTDCTQKINCLDSKSGINVLQGLLLLGNEDDRMCQNLLELGVDPGKRYVFLEVAPADATTTVKVDTNLDGGTAVHFAAFGKKLKCLKALVDAGADVNAETKDGFIPSDLTSDEKIRQFLVEAATSGPKTFAQLAAEGRYFAVRHKMRAGTLTSSDLMSKYDGKTAMEWIWSQMCEWRFAMKLDEDSLTAFKIMSEMKYRYGWDSIKDFGAPPRVEVALKKVSSLPAEAATEEISDDKFQLLLESVAAISSEIKEFRAVLNKD